MKLNPVKENVTELHVNDRLTVLFSYKTPVAAWVSGLGYVRTDKFWSVTTSRHINQWIGGSPAELRPQAYLETLTDVR